MSTLSVSADISYYNVLVSNADDILYINVSSSPHGVRSTVCWKFTEFSHWSKRHTPFPRSGITLKPYTGPRSVQARLSPNSLRSRYGFVQTRNSVPSLWTTIQGTEYGEGCRKSSSYGILLQQQQHQQQLKLYQRVALTFSHRILVMSVSGYSTPWTRSFLSLSGEDLHRTWWCGRIVHTSITSPCSFHEAARTRGWVNQARSRLQVQRGSSADEMVWMG